MTSSSLPRFCEKPSTASARSNTSLEHRTRFASAWTSSPGSTTICSVVSSAYCDRERSILSPDQGCHASNCPDSAPSSATNCCQRIVDGRNATQNSATISGSPISPPSPILSEMSPSLPGIVVVASLYLCCPRRWFGPRSAAAARSIASHLTDPKALVRSWKAVSDFSPSRSSLHVVACLIRTADSRRLPGM